MDKKFIKFPDNFKWGVSMCAFSIEGAATEDGKGESIWDRFTKEKKNTLDGYDCSVACDHYHRYREDIKIMADIGVNFYRMSVSWPRVIPDGTGKINQKGLDFYDRVIDELLKNNIEPLVAIYVWDLPQALVDNNKDFRYREIVPIFANYTEVVVKKLSDRVKNWETLCEPTIIATYGYKLGQHAPGFKLGPEGFYNVAHNLLLCHGTSVQVIRETAKLKPEIGLACNFSVKIPVSDKEEDINAAKLAWYDGDDTISGNAWWYEPIFKGRYPETLLKERIKYIKDLKPDDLKIISNPVDYCGVNIYSGDLVMHDDTPGSKGFKYIPYPPDFPRNNHSEGWPINPKSMYYGIKIMKELYDVKNFIVTENGICLDDKVSEDGKVHDPNRIDFLKKYLTEVQKLISEGINVSGYSIWTLIDNFECNQGYKARFGIVYMDLETKKRILKDSAYWYKETIKNNGFYID